MATVVAQVTKILGTLTGYTAKTIGVAVPVAGLAGDVILDIARSLDEQTVSQRLDRLEKLVKGIDARMAGINPDVIDTDLFREILLGAIKDEDERKVPLYAAFVELFATDKLSGSLVRLIAESLQSATPEELVDLEAFAASGRWPKRDNFNKQFFVQRMNNLSLLPPGALSRPYVTSLGTHVVKIVAMANLSNIQK